MMVFVFKNRLSDIYSLCYTAGYFRGDPCESGSISCCFLLFYVWLLWAWHVSYFYYPASGSGNSGEQSQRRQEVGRKGKAKPSKDNAFDL